MKRIFMLLTLILALMCPALASAEVSSDKMILDWTTSKVWVNGGERKQFLGRPVKFPICKIPANGSRKLNLNFGKFADESVGNWVTAQTYTFTYINGARF